MKKFLALLAFIVLYFALPSRAQAINCPSGFTSSGACGVSTSTGAATFWNQNALSGSESIIIPVGCTHCGQSMNTQAQVNVQAFTITWTFFPNEWNGALVFQNNVNNQASGAICSGTHCGFSAGAGCEAGFYQAFNSSNKSTDHVFALMFSDNYSNRTSSSGFVYSTAQIYQPQQSPCNPNDSQPWYWSTSKISTSPVPTTSPASSINTTTGDKYSAKLVYDGTTLTYTLFDVTAGGACPGSTCFTQSWNNVNIPSMVGSNTAWFGIAGGTGNTPSAFPFKVDSLVYTVNTPPSIPSYQTYTSSTAGGTPFSVAPSFSPAAGSYTGTQNVTISSSTTGAYFCYILSASTPSLMPQTDQSGGCTVGTLYTGAVSVPSSQTLYAQTGTSVNANLTGTQRANSDLTVGAYTISGGTYPVLYGFPGTSAPAGFTTPINRGLLLGTVVNATNNATLVVVGGLGGASYTAEPFTSFGVSDQYAQIGYTSGSGFQAQGVTSPCVNMTLSGNAVCYSGAAKQFVTWTAGVPSAVGAFCFFPGSSDTMKLSVTGTSYTVTETSFDGSCTQTITGFAGVGQPGFVLDQTIDATTRVQNFQADCFPSSCGVAAIPAITPATGSYINPQTVAITTTTPGATICYTTDGSTPLAATPGTCSHGTTYSGTFSTSGTVPYTETIKAIATISGGVNSTVASNPLTITGIVITAVVPPCSATPVCNVVLPDSSRQIHVQDNDPTDTITWTSSSGVTVSSPNNLQTAQVTFGATTGVSTITPGSGSAGPYTVSSTTQPTVIATSVVDPTKSATFTFDVVETTDQVILLPYYTQAWANVPVEVYSQIFGVSVANEGVTWAITTQPGGGDGTLTDSTFRSTEFKATVPGAYILTATETVAPHNTATTRIWLTSTTPPAYLNPVKFANLQTLSSGSWTKQSGTSCCGGGNTGSSTVSFGNSSPSLSGGSIGLTSIGNNYNTQLFTDLGCTSFPTGSCAFVGDLTADVSIYIPSSTNTPIALEGPNIPVYTGTNLLYPSVQCDSASGNWRLWNGASGVWANSGSTCTGFLTNTNVWQRVTAHYFVNQGANTMTYLDLTVNGVRIFSNLGTTFSGTPFVSTATIKAQVQIDGSTIGSPSTLVYYDNWNIIARANNSGKVLPADCSDPVFTSTFEIGPSQANTTIPSVVTTSTATGGCFRLHNEDTTGSAPTEYHQYAQWPVGGTSSHPIYFAGVPDSFGNLPIMDGLNATGNASVAGAFDVSDSGLWLFYSHDSTHGSCFEHYGTECGPSYVTIANLHERNIGPGVTRYAPGSPTISSIARSGGVVSAVVSAASDYGQLGVANINVINVTGGSTSFDGVFTIASVTGTTVTWNQAGANESGSVSGTSAIQEFWSGEQTCNDGRTGDHIQQIANIFENCGMGLWTNDNVDQYEWGGVSAEYFVGYNLFTGNGIAGNDLYHAAYLQGRNFVITGNRFLNPLATMQGGALKWRGTNSVISYNVMEGAFLRCKDKVEVQGGSPNVSVDEYLSDPDAWADGDTGGAPLLAGNQEGLFQDFDYGNICNTGANQVLHNGEDVDSGVTTRKGQAYYGFNTDNMNSQTQIINSASNNSLNAADFFSLRWYPFNDSFWGTAGGSMKVNTVADLVINFGVNLFSTGAVNTAAPIQSPNVGWSYICDGTCPWNGTVPLNTHMTGLTSFVTTSTNPIDVNYVPVAGSALAGLAVAPTGIEAQFKVRYWYDVTTNTLQPRTDLVAGWPTTGGAVPASGSPPPTLVSVTVTPNPATVAPTTTQSMSALCTYSDSSTTNCTSSATWSNGGSSFFTVGASTGVVAGVTAGSGTVTATYLTVPGTATVNVVTVMPGAKFVGPIQFTGPVTVVAP